MKEASMLRFEIRISKNVTGIKIYFCFRGFSLSQTSRFAFSCEAGQLIQQNDRQQAV
jgi:hypothetical protein